MELFYSETIFDYSRELFTDLNDLSRIFPVGVDTPDRYCIIPITFLLSLRSPEV